MSSTTAAANAVAAGRSRSRSTAHSASACGTAALTYASPVTDCDTRLADVAQASGTTQASRARRCSAIAVTQSTAPTTAKVTTWLQNSHGRSDASIPGRTTDGKVETFQNADGSQLRRQHQARTSPGVCVETSSRPWAAPSTSHPGTRSSRWRTRIASEAPRTPSVRPQAPHATSRRLTPRSAMRVASRLQPPSSARSHAARSAGSRGAVGGVSSFRCSR